jgi:chromosome segregation ATPase
MSDNAAVAADPKAEIERLEKQLEEARKDAAEYKLEVRRAEGDVATLKSLQDAIHADLKKLKGDLLRLSDERERWKNRALKAERLIEATSEIRLGALDHEIGRLRTELGQRDREVAGLKYDLQGVKAAQLDAVRERSQAEQRFHALEASVLQMQRARDRAQEAEAQALAREAEAKRKVLDLEVALGNSKQDLERAMKALVAIGVTHRKGHPKPLKECGICGALGE